MQRRLILIFKMKNENQKTDIVPLNVEILKHDSGTLTKVGDGFFMISGKELKFDAVRVYEPSYTLVSGMKTFEAEKNFILSAFSKGMFNLIDYVNEKSSHFTAHVASSTHLHSLLEIMENDIQRGFVPFKYGVALAVNTERARRFSGGLRV